MSGRLDAKERRLRAELEWLRSRYDHAQMSDAVFALFAASKRKSDGCSMQKELFSDAPPSSPIDGMRLKLERKIDLQKPCCSNVAIVRAGRGPHAAELRCAKCGSHRGWLPKEAATWLQAMIANFLEAKNDIHVFRDSKPNSHLTAREEIGIRQRETRIENGSRKSSANGR